MILVRVFGRLLIKTVEVAMWLAESVINLHKLLIYFLSNSLNSVDTSILVKDALVRVSIISVDLVSNWGIHSLSIGEV